MTKDSKRNLIAQITLEVRMDQNRTYEFDDSATELLGINRTDLRCMDILGMRAPLTAGQLAEATGLTTGAVTAVIDRMESAGWVRRLRDPTDRRRVLVEPTEKAFRESAAIWGPVGEDFQRLLARYSADELRLILDYLRRGAGLDAKHLARVKELASRRQGKSG
jgi:DNA-binding MarR family transcriptional regulator